METPRSEARLYLAKAKQFSAEATAAMKSSRNDAALLNAVHAVISATDAVSVALAARRSTDPDHQRSADLLQEIGGKSKELTQNVKQLRMLLTKKNVVEYESRQASAREASDAVKRADRFVNWASEAIENSNL